MWKFLDKYKERHTNSVVVSFFRLIYAIFKIDWVTYIALTIVTLFIPITYDAENWEGFWSLFGVFIFITILKYTCLSYKRHKEFLGNRIYRALDLQSETISSVNFYISSSDKWQKHIFEKTCEIVCAKIKELFTEELKVKTRVSVEYVYFDDKKGKKMIKMLGRQSAARQNGSREKPLADKEQYYVYKIFNQNNCGENILKKDEIQEPKNWFTNKKHSVKVSEYWGITVEEDDEVKFVLQIDFLDETKLKDSEIHSFINDYLRTFIQIIRMAYLTGSSIQ